MNTVQPRDVDGRFAVTPKAAPEVALSAGPRVEEVPSVHSGERNYRIDLDDGGQVTFNVADEGLRRRGAWRGTDTLTLTRQGDRLRSEYTIPEDGAAEDLRAALDGQDEQDAARTLANVNRHLHGLSGDRVTIRDEHGSLLTVHEDEHPLPGGETTTAEVFDRLESRFSYLYLRDGYYQATIQACLTEKGTHGQ